MAEAQIPFIQQAGTIPSVPAPPIPQPQIPTNFKTPNNKGGKKGGRPNFFKRQEQKFGNDWSLKNKNLGREISSLIIDFAKGNIEPEDIMFFYDQNFSFAVRTTTAENVALYGYRVEANKAYINNANLSGRSIIPDDINKIIYQDEYRLRVWKDFYQFLMNLFDASRAGGTDAVIYVGMDFVNYMTRTYRDTIHNF